MLVRWSLKMLNILVLCPVLLVASVQTLTIDSQLGTSIEDCFERISIAEQLPPNAIYRNVTELTTRECEQICKQDKQCQSFDYGVGAKGNATCDLSKADEKSLKEKNILLRHPDYDVYVRRFQCEQSPPSPIQPQFDEPLDAPGPAHRPVFRPVDDEKLPFTGDYLISGDLESYGVARPVYKPQYNERPDDYTNLKPDNDVGPSYGVHKPQDMPYRPEKPSESGSHKPKPDPYDVLQFQDPHRPNDRPGYPVNDYERPKPPYKPEKPGYPVSDQYNRPIPPYGPEKPGYPANDNNRPMPPYGSERPGYPVKDQYNRPLPPYGSGKPGYPVNDNYNKPISPYGSEKPGYPANDHYNRPLSPYGSERPEYPLNDHYRPRPPNGPEKPGNLGDNNYGPRPSQVPERPGYPVDDYNRPRPSYVPEKPGYQSNDDNKPTPPYLPEKPVYQYIIRRNRKPKPQLAYGQAGLDDGVASAGYYKPYPGNNLYDQSRPVLPSLEGGYAQNAPYDDNSIHNEIMYPPRPYKPHNPTYEQGIYGYGTYSSQNSYSQSQGINAQYYGSVPVSAHSGYGAASPYRPDPIPERPVYGEQSDAGYGSAAKPQQHGYGLNKPSYSNGRPSYDIAKPSYGIDRPTYNIPKPAYGNDRPSHDISKPAYGTDIANPSYNNDRPSYGLATPSYSNDKLSYGLATQSYGINRPSYGVEKPAYGVDKPIYDVGKPTYGVEKPGYGAEKPTYGAEKPAYGVEKPAYGADKPAYGAEKPVYSNDKPYGTNKPAYGLEKPSYSSQPSYGVDKPSYNTDKPYSGSEKPSYTSSQGSSSHNDYSSLIAAIYGNHNVEKPSYESQSVYGNNQSSYGTGSSLDSSYGSYGGSQGSYGGSQDTFGLNTQSAYGSQSDSNRPAYGSRPADRPGFAKPQTSKPAYGNADHVSGYGNPPAFDENRPDYTPPNNPSYGTAADEPAYGNEKPIASGFDKPNIKPVYEYQMEIPSNVPSYIARPGGEVVSSKPMVIGDFDAGYGRNPVRGDMFKEKNGYMLF